MIAELYSKIEKYKRANGYAFIISILNARTNEWGAFFLVYSISI